MPDRIINNYLLPTPVPNQTQVDHAQALADAGKYSESWRYLAELGDSYADNAADVTGDPISGFGKFMEELVKQHWISTADKEAYHEKFSRVAGEHLDNYLNELRNGRWPSTGYIEKSYRDALEKNGLDAMTAIDGAINAGLIRGLWPWGLEVPLYQMRRYEMGANEFTDLPSDEAREHLATAFLNTIKAKTIDARTWEDTLVLPQVAFDTFLHGLSYFSVPGRIMDTFDPNWEEKVSSIVHDSIVGTVNSIKDKGFWPYIGARFPFPIPGGLIPDTDLLKTPLPLAEQELRIAPELHNAAPVPVEDDRPRTPRPSRRDPTTTRDVERRTFTAHTSLGDELQFRSFSGEERLSSLFDFRVRLLSKTPAISAKSLLGQDLSIEMDLSTPLHGPGTRFLSGQIVQFTHAGREGEFHAYQARLRPWLWHTSVRTNFKIFQHKTIPEIVQDVLAPYGFVVTHKLTEPYRTWDYLVQYGESDFNFISRLLEHEGAYYYFEHHQGHHALVLADGIGSHGPLPAGARTIAFRDDAGAGKVHDEDIIDHWTSAEAIAPGRFFADDYDFEHPRALLTTEQQHTPGHSDDHREVYAWPGGYTRRDDGETYARIRLEQQQAQRETVTGTGNARQLAPGYYFDLTEHPQPDQNQAYLILSARYQFEENIRRSDGPTGADSGTKYRVDFEAVPQQVPWHSPITTPKPRTAGPQTAVVTGPANEEIYTDQYGRVKVQFHWDRDGQYDENTSCWIRVSQTWAGAGYGSMHIPRIGQEVIVDFLNGDPDYPIITGRVYNALQMPPWELPRHKTQSGIKTRSSQDGVWGDGLKDSPGTANALRFEDQKGAEQLWLHAQKDQLTEVEHDEDKWVGNDRRKSIDGHEHTVIGKTRTEKVGERETVTIGTNRTRVVRAKDELLVGADKRDAITNTYLIEAGQQLRLVCGNTVLELNAGGTVNLTCEQFNFTAMQSGEINTLGGVLDLNRGSSPGAVPDTQGVAGTIKAEVEAYYDNETDGSHLPDMASALNGAQAPFALAAPFNGGGAQSSGSDAPAQENAQPQLSIMAGLGDEVNELIALSPSLQTDLVMLHEKDWKIRYTAPGDKKGSYAKRDARPPHIVIDRRYQGDPTQVAQILAHEVGHATYDYDPDLSTLEDYILSTYGDEGMAVMNEVRVREEILAAGGRDIHISGDSEKYDFYYDRLDDLKFGRIDLEAARNAIGAVYVQGGKTSTTGESYEDYHGNWYINKYLPYLEERKRLEEQGAQDRKGRINENN